MGTQRASILVIVILFLFLILINSLAMQFLGNPTDQISLLVFKSKIDPSGVLKNWNTNSSICNWRGVTCNNMTDQRVTSLDLEDLNLAGSISPHLANLSYLSHLNLHKNSIHGILPPELGQLFRLQNLTLSYNLIRGTIPSSLSQCTRLVTINLRTNKLEGIIPYELGGLGELKILSLHANFLTGHIPSALGNISSMTNLLLSENNLQGSIPEELGRLSSLLNLQLESTNITGDIPPSVLNISSLVLLSFTMSKLSGSLPYDMFSRLPNLQIFYVPGNSLTGPIPSSLANASNLVRLDLGYNEFNGQIPVLRNMLNIQHMSLGSNKLSSDGAGGMDFVTSLANSSQLQTLELSLNRLTGNLPPSIGSLSKKLYKLNLARNQFSGSLPAEISKLTGLSGLYLGYNFFTGSIPPSLGEMPNLQRLLLSDNRFSGNIPESLGNLSQLYDMRLNRNRLTGTIPASLGNLQLLQYIDLSANMLNGTIPKEILNIPSLSSTLNLSSNLLSGSVPMDIGTLKMVQGIDLSMNCLSGGIPIAVGESSSLWVLDLSKNYFQGPIPDSFGKLRSIEYILLSSNKLSGKIPSSLESLKFIKYLDLSVNQLGGNVPNKGIFTNSSGVSLSGNPNLCGGTPVFELPKCIVRGENSRRNQVKMIIGVSLGFVALSILLCYLFYLLRNWRRSKVHENVVSFDGPHRLYTYHDLRIATGNFNPVNLIGEGTFGLVYKGVLRDGIPAAIKVFNTKQQGAFKSFLSECEALRNVRHRYLVKIISACSNHEYMALLFRFMSNGSLEQWLHKANRPWLELNMNSRLEVVNSVAVALEYLHHDCETPVIHCDLKPSNVLLDENMIAHVGDFGLARMLLRNPAEIPLTRTFALKGSIGYIPPEYGMGGEVSREGDVYSFGILMLEMFTGKKPTDEMFTGEMDLQKWVAMALPDRIADIIEPECIEKDEEIWLVSLLKIGLTCAAKLPKDRPTMRDVSSMIRNVKSSLLHSINRRGVVASFRCNIE